MGNANRSTPESAVKRVDTSVRRYRQGPNDQNTAEPIASSFYHHRMLRAPFAMLLSACLLAACGTSAPRGPWLPEPERMTQRDWGAKIDDELQVATGHAARGEYMEALDTTEHALGLAREHGYSAGQYNAHWLAGYVHYRRGEFDRALARYVECVDIQEEALGPSDPNTLRTYAWIESLAMQRKDYANAIAWYQRSIVGFSELNGEDHFTVANARLGLASALTGQKRYDDALVELERARSSYESQPRPDRRMVALTIGQTARVLERQGHSARALARYHRCVSIYEALYGKRHPSTAQGYFDLGMSYWRSGNQQAARHWLEHALSIFDESLGPDHVLAKGTRHNLAQLQRAGRKAPAKGTAPTPSASKPPPK